eukprot:m.107051 g.107051  ORF g.107051 m.107051 type:complete len:2103 (-) comp9168_c1_seq1:222-6530(-)
MSDLGSNLEGSNMHGDDERDRVIRRNETKRLKPSKVIEFTGTTDGVSSSTKSKQEVIFLGNDLIASSSTESPSKATATTNGTSGNETTRKIVSAPTSKQGSSRVPSYSSTPKIEVPDLEGLVVAKKDAIEADPLRHMLLPMEDEVFVRRLKREKRTMDHPGEMPSGDHLSLFGQKCLEFFDSDWNLVQSTVFSSIPTLHRSLNRSVEFASDIEENTQEIVHDLFKLPQNVLLSNTLSCAHTQIKDGSKTIGRKDTRLKTRAKKRVVTLKFKSSKGPLVLELAKEEKKKEDIDLSTSTSIEVDHLSTDTFLIYYSTHFITFQCDDTAMCEKWVNTILENVELYNRFQTQSMSQASNISMISLQPPVADETRVSNSTSSTESAFHDLSNVEESDNRHFACAEASVPDMLSLYQAVDGETLKVDEYGEDHQFLSPFVGFQFTVTCEELLFRLHLMDGARPVNPEPFYCSLQLYDIKAHKVVSERFHFDLNTYPQMGYCKMEPKSVDKETCSRSAVFSVAKKHSGIFLVLFIEKTLQKEANAVIEAYLKGSDEKTAKKQSKSAADAISKHEGFLTRFGYSIRQVFDDSGSLDVNGKFSPIFRHDVDKMQEEDMFKTLQDFAKTQKIKGQMIPGDFRARVTPFLLNFPTVTSNLEVVKPLVLDSQLPPHREVQPFYPSLVTTPYLSFYDFLYIYPLAVNLNFSSKKLLRSSGRNIVLRVCIMNDDRQPLPILPEGRPCIFGYSHTSKIRSHAVASVLYHTKTPSFIDEVKVAVPPSANPNLHVLFSFYHLSVKEKKKAKNMLTPIGHAFIPIPSLLAECTQEISLPIVAALHNDLETLGPNYLSAHENMGLGMSGDNAPGVKFLDNGKELFHFKVRSVSSVRSHNIHLTKFFLMCEKHDRSVRSDKEVSSAIKALHALDEQQLFRFMPVIFNQLLALLPTSPSSYDQVSENVIRYLLFAVSAINRVDQVNGKKSALLLSYVEHVFQTTTNDTTGIAVHDGVASHLSSFLAEDDSRDGMLDFAWFFLRIITKSMSQSLQLKNSFSLPRNKRFSNEYYNQLLKLFNKFSLLVLEFETYGFRRCRELNRSLGTFVLQLFPIADRGMVFKFVEIYMANVPFSTDQPSFVVECRLEFIWMMCTYKEYVPLNLPLLPKTIESGIPQCNSTFKRHHYLTWVLLSNVRGMIETAEDTLRRKALTVLRSVLAMHDSDPRYQEREEKERIALLYFPIVHIALENTHRMTLAPPSHSHESSTDTNPRLDELSYFETQELLACFLFVLKNSNQSYLIHFHRSGFTPDFFVLLKTCISLFSFKGRKEIITSLLDAPVSKRNAIKLLEEEYTTPLNRRRSSVSNNIIKTDWRAKRKNNTNSTALERTSILLQSQTGSSSTVMSNRQSGINLEESVSSQQPSRLRLSTMPSKAMSSVFSKDNVDDLVFYNGQFSVEAFFVVLDMVELILEVFPDSIEENDGVNNITSDCVELLLLLLDSNPSDFVVPFIFRAMTAFSVSYKDVFFNPQVDYSLNMCYSLLQACNSKLEVLRHYGCAFIYILLTKNLGRVTQDVLVSISKLAGSLEGSDGNLRRSLKRIVNVATNLESESPRGFAEEVDDLMQRLSTVLVNTAKFKKYSNEPDVLVDLQYDVAKSYSTTPSLRLTWLESLAALHVKHNAWLESGMCVVHGAAIVVQVLGIKNPSSPYSLRNFYPISKNVAMERLDALAAEEAKTLTSPLFTVRGLLHMLHVAITCFKKAQCFEFVSTLYNMITPRYEEQYRYHDLSSAHRDLHECYESVLSFNRNKTRHLATYFRVGFYGKLLEDLDGKEFIYKEPQVTPLATVSLILREQYTTHAGSTIEIISHSNVVNRSDLDPHKVYIQITHVEPYFEGEDVPRQCVFEEFVGLKRFIFETPYTVNGKARSENVAEQCKRKTILSLENDQSFPHLRYRLEVVQPHELIDLQPIQVACDELKKKLHQLTVQIEAEQTNPIMLQIQLQGALSSQVNAGPMHYAEVFLANAKDYPKKDVKTLCNLFEQYLEKLQIGVDVNQQVITEQQLGLQAQLHSGLDDMNKRLVELIPSMKRKRRRSMRQAPPLLVASHTQTKEPGINFLNNVFQFSSLA